MELAATQTLLARIYTDSRLRTRFYADPVAVGSEFGLSAATARSLAAVPETDIHEFAKAVRRRRLEATGRLLPCSTKCLGPRFGEAFREYVLGHPLPAECHAWHDAVAFEGFFQSWCQQHPEITPWQREVLRFESERLAFTHRRARLLVRFCLYPGHRTARDIAAGRPPKTVWPLPGLRIFWRWKAGGEMHEHLL